MQNNYCSTVLRDALKLVNKNSFINSFGECIIEANVFVKNDYILTLIKVQR